MESRNTRFAFHIAGAIAASIGLVAVIGSDYPVAVTWLLALSCGCFALAALCNRLSAD